MRNYNPFMPIATILMTSSGNQCEEMKIEEMRKKNKTTFISTFIITYFPKKSRSKGGKCLGVRNSGGSRQTAKSQFLLIGISRIHFQDNRSLGSTTIGVKKNWGRPIS